MEKLTFITVSANGRKVQLLVKGTQVDAQGKTLVSQNDLQRALRALGIADQLGQTYSIG